MRCRPEGIPGNPRNHLNPRALGQLPTTSKGTGWRKPAMDCAILPRDGRPPTFRRLPNGPNRSKGEHQEEVVAEGVGFEPTIPVSQDKRLAGARTRPLCDPSAKRISNIADWTPAHNTATNQGNCSDFCVLQGWKTRRSRAGGNLEPVQVVGWVGAHGHAPLRSRGNDGCMGRQFPQL